MRREIAVVWLSIILILTSIVLFYEFSDQMTDVKGATYYVNETGSFGAFSSIQDAINASSDGDTVFVYSGIYNENIIVNKTINLTGENRDMTTINGSDNAHIVNVTADYVNISGLTIRCGGFSGWPNVISGLVLENVSNCEIFDNIISDCYPGINLYNTNENIVNGNNISSNEDGIWLKYSSRNIITYNTFMYNDIPIDGDYAGSNNIISYNEISYNVEGIWLLYTSDNIVSYNNITHNNWFNIYLQTVNNISILNNNCSDGYGGITISDSSNVTISNNIMLSEEDFGIDCQNTNYVDIRNNIVESSFMGFHIFNIIGLNLTNNHISVGFRGLDLSNSLYGYIANNTIANSPEGGFYIWSISKYNLFTNNTFYNNFEAFWADVGEGNTISENTFYNNTYAMSVQVSMSCDILKNDFYDNEYAIYFWNDVYSWNITNNSISNNTHGIFFELMDNDYNIISENTVADNEFAINISQSNNNLIYHNNFINNTYQASDDSVNKWDNDYPRGGNYWSDYSGVDNFKGPDQDIPGSDGIGDTNYTIDSDSKDNYPLIAPYTSMEFENYTILYPGWNLVSIPLTQQDENITVVLEMIEGYYNAVKWFDASDKSDPWKNYVVGKPFGNDLQHLNETMGFWIHITRPGETTFLYNGTEPTVNQTIQLYEDWNMVGYPTLTSYNRTAGLNNLTFGTDVDAIQWFDASTETWHDMGPDDYFVPCRSYWIHAITDCEWEVPL